MKMRHLDCSHGAQWSKARAGSGTQSPQDPLTKSSRHSRTTALNLPGQVPSSRIPSISPALGSQDRPTLLACCLNPAVAAGVISCPPVIYDPFTGLPGAAQLQEYPGVFFSGWSYTRQLHQRHYCNLISLNSELFSFQIYQGSGNIQRIAETVPNSERLKRKRCHRVNATTNKIYRYDCGRYNLMQYVPHSM